MKSTDASSKYISAQSSTPSARQRYNSFRLIETEEPDNHTATSRQPKKTAALITDALRAQVLEICGYRTQVVEFIDTEHTPKNLLIKAVKRQSKLNPTDFQNAVHQYESLKKQFGIQSFYLEHTLGNDFQELCLSGKQNGTD